MPTPGSETYKSMNPLETREKATYSSHKPVEAMNVEPEFDPSTPEQKPAYEEHRDKPVPTEEPTEQPGPPRIPEPEEGETD